jgi:molybdenum cofactor biosynthesis enzyme MoaA
MLLDEHVRNLIHDYIDDVAISIDSTKPEEFARLRPMGKTGLPEILNGIELLVQRAKRWSLQCYHRYQRHR